MKTYLNKQVIYNQTQNLPSTEIKSWLSPHEMILMTFVLFSLSFDELGHIHKSCLQDIFRTS